MTKNLTDLLGRTLEDTGTGFVGTCTAVAEYLDATPRIELSGLDADGRPVAHWADEGRCTDAP